MGLLWLENGFRSLRLDSIRLFRRALDRVVLFELHRLIGTEMLTTLD
jgi:hypothetical protein